MFLTAAIGLFTWRGIFQRHAQQPKEEGEAVTKKMEEMGLPSLEDLFFMLIAEGATILAYPLNVSLFNISPKQLIDGVKVADPAHYYKEVVIPADMNLTF